MNEAQPLPRPLPRPLPQPLHRPLMLAEMLAHLRRADGGGTYIDATFGRGGYSRALLADPAAHVIGIDRDPEAMSVARALAAAEPRFQAAEGPFGELARLATPLLPAGGADGVVFDLGVSSPQLDDPARGFSFRADGPLDMRMGATGETAAELVQRLSEAELADLIFELGEERFSRRIARAIVAARPLATTAALAAVVRRAVPKSEPGLDPATRTFQALRIAVNDELGQLRQGLTAALDLLAPEGRLVAISFHSLEDRIVKNFMAAAAGRLAQPSRHVPITAPLPPPRLRLITSKPVLPGAAELAANPRARSARLRAAVKLAPSAARRAA